MQREKQMHPTLSALIDFERERSETDISWSRQAPGTNGAFRPVIQFQGPRYGYGGRVLVPQDGKLHEIMVAAGIAEKGEIIGLAHDGDFYRLAAVDGRHVTLTFDLEAVFENPPEGLNPKKLFEDIAGQAIPKAKAYIAAYKWEHEADKYLEWNTAGFEEQVGGWRQNVHENEYALDRAHSTIVNLLRKNAELRDMLEAAGKVTRVKREELSKSEFQSLLKMMPTPVTSVEMQGGELQLETVPLTVEHDGVDYDLGSFHIRVGNDRVRIHSPADRVYPHPHVSDSGIVCWGSIGTEVARLLGEREHAALVAVIIEFLRSYNAEDAYRRIEFWGDDPPYDDD